VYEPPLSIPNREVKVHRADDTWIYPGKVGYASLQVLNLFVAGIQSAQGGLLFAGQSLRSWANRELARA